ncbi:MAG: ATP-dependent Clp protease proteolytic subunit, partial [bacterium]|nr:ATP-dependent Clp protease proteolytic subunit [bacterium]
MDIIKMREDLAAAWTKERKVFIDGDMVKDIPIFIHTALLGLDQKNQDEITIVFRSGGGESDMGMQIYETLKTLRSPTLGIVFKAGSAASLALQGCTKRRIMQSGRILVHNPAIGDTSCLRYNEFYDEAISFLTRVLKSNKEFMDKVFLERTKMKRDQL